MKSNPVDRRRFLQLSGSLGILGTAAPFALELAAAGSAAGQTASDYRALVCVFLSGGNDAHNSVLATDTDTWNRYWAARNTGSDPIALMPAGTAPVAPGQTSSVTGRVAGAATPEAWGGILPITPRTANPIPAGTNASSRTFALHPFLGPVKTLFDSGRLAVLANVGTLVQPITKAQYNAKSVPVPPSLYSHNDQQSVWQSGAAEGSRIGWGGQMADLVSSMNGANTIFTAISPSGNAVFLSGRNVFQYQVTTSSAPALVVNGQANSTLFGSSVGPQRLREIVQDTSPAHVMMADYATVVNRSMGTAATLNAATAAVSGVRSTPTYINPITGASELNILATSLQTVVRLIGAAQALGVKRQVFFVTLGGWDSHNFQNINQPNLLAKLAAGLSYFDSALANINGVDRRSQVTTFTASDFSRTFTTNGDGTDHAWGSHHFIMGGAVRGQDMYGQYPTLGADLGSFNNPDMVADAAVIPTTSVDQYGATLGSWFGVSSGDLDTIFPNLRNFPRRNLGFV